MSKSLSKFFLIAVAAAMILTACGPTATPEATEVAVETEAPADVVTEEPTPVPMEPAELEIWVSGRVSEAGPPPEDWVAYQIIQDELLIDLELVLLPSSAGDQDTKINTAAASNSLPDLFFVSRDTLYDLVQVGLVAPVDDLLPLMPVRTETHYSDPNRNALVTFDGQMYGLPDPGQIPMTDGLVIRQDWLDALGLQAPTTLDDFMTVATAFTFDDPDGNGQADTYGFCAFIDGSGLSNMGLGPRFNFIYGAYGVAGVWNLNSADEFGLNARDPRFMEATQFIRSMVEAGVIDPDWPTLSKDDFRAGWKQGQCGIMSENFAALANRSNYAAFDENNPEGEWVVIPPPVGPYGDSSEGVIIQTARIYAVSQRAIDEGKGPAIARLLEWMATDGYMLMAFGEEGVNFNLDNNGYITLEGIDPELAWNTSAMQPLTQLANMVYIFTDVELQARYQSHTSLNGRTIEPLAFLAGFSEQPWTEATGSAIINPPANAADFTRFYSENLVQFVLGQQDLNEETWAAFLEGLDSLGAADLEAVAKQDLIDAGFLR
ncbi:MAG: extracellular solute-binding protein [Anaerolineales bacterium]|nr:extracellular solute-binding protein [Anaerolineales bacterium]